MPLIVQHLIFAHPLSKWLIINSGENSPVSVWVNQSNYKSIKLSRSGEAVRLQETVKSVTVSRVFAITAEVYEPLL